MNKPLKDLWQIAQKPVKRVIGCMSGTSMDGLDVALCRISGSGSQLSLECEEFISIPYPESLKDRMLSLRSAEQVPARALSRLHSELGSLTASYINKCLSEWGVEPEEVDLIGSHGQTIYHAPAADGETFHATFQIGDADHIALATGIPVVSDFRQKHTAGGGEGAPLAQYFDEALFRDDHKHRMMLNIGGIANLTWLPSMESGEEIMSGDSGPGNTLIDETARAYFEQEYDENGKLASQGIAHSELLRYVLLEPYFREDFPKTTGQESFQLSFIRDIAEGHGIILQPYDMIATLTEITIQSICRAADHLSGGKKYAMYVSGGGANNPVIMQGLQRRLAEAEVVELSSLNMNPDAKEAIMMAFFASECISGTRFRVGKKEVSLGKISLPD